MTKATPETLTVLAIDDDSDFRELLTRALKKAGFRNVIVTASARTALDFLKNGDEPVSIILLDLDMPDMNGVAFLRKLRADAEQRVAGIPVIVVTAHDSSDVEEGIRPFGIHGFLPKPPDATGLRTAILGALQR
jgi:two-component system chemotaxis response regulator CheY